jgi:NADPH:quinone reductase
MKAVTIEPGGVLALRDHEDPRACGEEVLIRIRAAGVNNADLLQAMGQYPPPKGVAHDIPGLEFAGEVVGLGPAAHRFSLGDRVMAVVGGGAQAELISVHERLLMPIPEVFSWEQAAGFPEAFVTAHDALFVQGDLRPGDRVLISGAAGGIGTAGVQIAAAAGAEVIASVRNADNRERVRQMGAIRAIDPADAEKNGPYDLIMELVGATNFDANLRALDIGGRIVVIGTGSGTEANLDLRALSQKRATVRASTLRARAMEEKAIATRAVERELLPLVREGKIDLVVAASYKLKDADLGYEAFRRSGKVGKIILLP